MVKFSEYEKATRGKAISRGVKKRIAERKDEERDKFLRAHPSLEMFG